MILASTSPRRQELIKLLGKPYRIEVRETEEKIDLAKSVEENVQSLAKQKAMAVATAFPSELVIGADTVVCLDGKILGKPKDAEDAKRTLAMLSGRIHEVHTGVALVCIRAQRIETFVETTKVKMKQLSQDEIEAYVASGEVLDKAGSYGIQGKGAIYIEGIEGDYYNVVGLPVHRLYEALKKEEV